MSRRLLLTGVPALAVGVAAAAVVMVVTLITAGASSQTQAAPEGTTAGAQPSCTPTVEGVQTFETAEETLAPTPPEDGTQGPAVPYDPEALIRRTEIQDPNSPLTVEGCQGIPDTPVPPAGEEPQSP